MPSRAEARALREAAPAVVQAREAGDLAPGSGAAGDRIRRAIEWVLRAAALVLLAWLLWQSLQPSAPATAERATGDRVAESLVAWAARPPSAAELRFDALPTARERDLAAALRRAGVPVRWSGDSLPALAASVAAVADPAGGARIMLAAPRGARLGIADAVGPLDSLAVSGEGATLSLASVAGLTAASARGGSAVAAPPDSVVLRRVLVLGRAGWEAKFTIAALEERGWAVDARLFVAPGMLVTQGSPTAPDTARYALVVALDSTAAGEAGRIVRYVRGGGGLVLGAEAGRLASFAPVAAAAPGGRVAGVLGALQGGEPRRGLALQPLRRLAPGTVVLERRDSLVALAARRTGLGRVVQSGYEETWRWRMSGGPDAMDAHRTWWARLAAGAAYAPTVSRSSGGAGARDAAGVSGSPVRADPAPRAALAATLGAPSAAAAATLPASREALGVATFTVLALLLLLEWASRRARGAR